MIKCWGRVQRAGQMANMPIERSHTRTLLSLSLRATNGSGKSTKDLPLLVMSRSFLRGCL
jgi:hypothetical protein